jgi:TetR/AcrR family transcriptional regulator, mexCD-oprJ operon repressor
MAEPRLTERQQAIADRNVAAILDATEELLARRGQASISAVAKHSGVSRVTVYAHFPTSEALLEAAVERAVGQTMGALHAANLDEGPPV